jgi:hypothetical protein
MPTEFKNAEEVVKYLNEQGWKVSLANFYNHRKEAKIQPDFGKRGFTLKAVNRYAQDHLHLAATLQKSKNEDLAHKKRNLEIEKLEQDIKADKLNYDIKAGKHLPLDDIVLQLAGRAAIFESGMKNKVRSEIGQMIKMVNGDPAKTADLLDFIFENVIDSQLNEYARPMTFDVDFAFLNEDATEVDSD